MCAWSVSQVADHGSYGSAGHVDGMQARYIAFDPTERPLARKRRRIPTWRRNPGAVAALSPSGERTIRAAEVVGALSLATDLGTGQPLEHALRTAVLAVQLGELAGASAQRARRHLLRRAAPRLRVHVQRARGSAGVRRRHRVQSRLLPHRHDQPRGGARVLPGQLRGRPPAGGSRRARRGSDRQRRPEGP